jgi:hypothetical protein
MLRIFCTLLPGILLQCFLIPLKPAGALNAAEVRTLTGEGAEEGFLLGVIAYCENNQDNNCRKNLEGLLPLPTILAGKTASTFAPVQDGKYYNESTAETCEQRARLTTAAFVEGELKLKQNCALICTVGTTDLEQAAIFAGWLGGQACDIEETGKIFSFYQYNL